MASGKLRGFHKEKLIILGDENKSVFKDALIYIPEFIRSQKGLSER